MTLTNLEIIPMFKRRQPFQIQKAVCSLASTEFFFQFRQHLFKIFTGLRIPVDQNQSGPYFGGRFQLIFKASGLS